MRVRTPEMRIDPQDDYGPDFRTTKRCEPGCEARLPAACAACGHAVTASCTSRAASASVAPPAEQPGRSGASALTWLRGAAAASARGARGSRRVPRCRHPARSDRSRCRSSRWARALRVAAGEDRCRRDSLREGRGKPCVEMGTREASHKQVDAASKVERWLNQRRVDCASELANAHNGRCAASQSIHGAALMKLRSCLPSSRIQLPPPASPSTACSARSARARSVPGICRSDLVPSCNWIHAHG